MKTWKIYKHTNKINGKSYIGQTCQDNPKLRWSGGSGYSKRNHVFYNAIKKYGWDNFDHEILIDNIPTLEEANKLEIELIANYHTYIRDPLCNGYNTTIGGSGRGHAQSEETKKKISNALKGRPITPEHQQKINEKLQRFKKPVICIETGIVYESVAEAARQNNISRENLKFALHKVKAAAGGYHWAEVSDIEKIQQLQKLNGKCKQFRRKVYCIETKEIFESITAAAKAKGLKSGASISQALKNNSIAAGYHWKYYN